MIDEKKLIEELEAIKNRIQGKTYGWYPLDFEDVIEYIKGFPKIGEWIPCNKRLPNQNDNNINNSSLSIPVLVKYDSEEEPEVLHYNTFTEKFCYDQIDFTNEVIAWMPLPEPYKEEVTE